MLLNPLPILTALLCAPLLVSGNDRVPALMGSYHGFAHESSRKQWWKEHPEISARVIALGNDRYDVQILPEFHKRAQPYAEGEATAAGDSLLFRQGDWEVTFQPEGATGTVSTKDGKVGFTLEKKRQYSPTLGLQAPEGAVVLFDGTDLSQWEHRHGGSAHAPKWKVLGSGAMEIVPRSGGSLFTQKDFGDCRLHLEFRVPYEPGKHGQDAGNSGLFFQDTYEVQILNSYGENGHWDECGALYKVRPPQVNASAPPGVWQSYDVDFRAARFDENGECTSPPIITVLHNGITIHHEVALEERTAYTYAARKRPPQRGPGSISLQDHGHRVQFRNIWVLPITQ